MKGNTLHGHIMRGLYEGPDKLLFRDIFLDAAQVAGIVMALPEVDAERVAAEGGSQEACAALEAAHLPRGGDISSPLQLSACLGNGFGEGCLSEAGFLEGFGRSFAALIRPMSTLRSGSGA
ncbi:acetylxylan esterase [Bradyrhizobium yuanmingense]|nr:acetylxylan esterase [Bradyrhizobium yuanmingense]MDF0523436.1 acetylxylan esterase [Bradyrhizobium yuanmingense]